jgi:hypothetical protein
MNGVGKLPQLNSPRIEDSNMSLNVEGKTSPLGEYKNHSGLVS